jgi:hypothetical protein
VIASFIGAAIGGAIIAWIAYRAGWNDARILYERQERRR